MFMKCVCVFSMEIVDEVMRILVEKFCLDMKMFFNLNYFFYEVYLSGGKLRNFLDQINEVVIIVCDGCKFYVFFFVFMWFGYKL